MIRPRVHASPGRGDPWQLNPWSLGSYSTYKPGYQTTVVGIEREPEGNCFFAGEHTENQNGFLNSAVQSGLRAAREVAASLA
jgi:monoamine oxidase